MLEQRGRFRQAIGILDGAVGKNHHGSRRLAEGAQALKVHEPDAVMWACTSGSFVFGWDGAHDQVARLADLLGLPVSSTSVAFVEALRACGLEQVAIAASYPEDVAVHFAEFLRRGGAEIVSFGSHDIYTAAEVGLLKKEQVVDMVQQADTPQAQAILVPDTAMHSLLWLDDLEAAVGKPVLTANQVTVWQGLRIAGGPTRLDGLGALFRA